MLNLNIHLIPWDLPTLSPASAPSALLPPFLFHICHGGRFGCKHVNTYNTMVVLRDLSN